VTERSAEPPPLAATEPAEPELWTELVESEARLRALLNATGALIVATDDQIRITEFNPAAERLFGRLRADALGRRYSELLPAGVRRKVDRDFERVLSGKSIRLFENAIMDADGRTRIVLWDVRRLADADGTALGVVAVGHDITARVAASG
jgi:PAS domain S-box-containing protein